MQNKQGKNRKNSHESKRLKLLLISILSIITILPGVMAHCPLCTGATIIGVGITRSLGLDDSIIGVFVGAMIVSSALWVNNILKKKNIGGNAFLRIGSVTLIFFVLTVLSFYFAGIFGLGNPYRIFGMEKIVFGSISGAVVTLGVFFASSEIKERRGKPLFSFQTMILTLGALILNALIFWLVFK